MDTLNRWQDRIEIAAGLWLCISPLVLGLPEAAAWCAVVVGVGVILLASEDLFLTSQIENWGNALLGIGLMVSPWAWRYADHQPAMLNALVMGLLVLVLSGWTLERVLYDKFKVWKEHHHAHS
jgi:SPW repeat